MANQPKKRKKAQPLMQAALLETICILGGLIGFYKTGHAIWIVIGLLAGLGFSLPAVIRFARESKEQDDASR
jgi:uncharacterized membrane protein (UPF0136 family)